MQNVFTEIRALIKNIYDVLPKQFRFGLRRVLPNLFTLPLHKQLPLPLPVSLHIDPANTCNFKCTFCPTGDSELLKSINRPRGIMHYELFRKIIDDLKLIVDSSGKKVIELHLYKDGEPFLHKQLGEMIAYTKSQNVAESVQTTTNGALLTKERAIEIIEKGLDVIRISIEHVSNEGYKKLTQNYSDYEKIKDNVKLLFEEKTKRSSKLKIHSKILDVNFTEGELKKFVSDFKDISDEISINQLMGWSNSGKKDFTLGARVKRGMGGKARLRRKKVCPEPFRSLAINFDGQVSICCVDWSYGTIIGDLNKDSLSDIWNGEKIKQFRSLHLNGDRNSIKACSNCHYLLGFPDHLYLDNKVKYLKKIYDW